MGATELAAIVPVLGIVVAHLLGTTVLFLWARWVSRRQPRRLWRLISWLPLIALGFSALGLVVFVVMLIQAFSELDAASADMRANALARGISVATNVTAMVALPSALLYATSFISSVVGTVWRRPDSAEEDTAS